MPQYCTIYHKIGTYVIDGEDPDRNPDYVPVTGVVTFEPLLDKGDSVVVTTGGESETVTLTPIEARITGGELYHRGEKGIRLFAGGPDTNPQRVRYRARFTNLIAGGQRINLKDILFETIPNGQIHLPAHQPVPAAPYPGYSPTLEESLENIRLAETVAVDSVSGEVERKINDLFPISTALPGQVPKWDGTKFRWSWMDQHPTRYHNIY